MVQLVRHDLQFILNQIKIAEAHAAGTPLTEIRVDAQGNVTTNPNAALAISDPLSPYGLRTVDGSYNNLVAGRDQWGASDNPFPRVTEPVFRNETDDAMPPGYVPGNNNDYALPGSVVDADPRLISNLIVDQTLDNPAAIAAALSASGLTGEALIEAVKAIRAAHLGVKNDVPDAQMVLDNLLGQHGITMDGNTVLIPNVAPDEGLSASYNGWFTLFGQFFDHGLDLVAKGGNGTVYIPLQPGDPLYNPATPHTNFMVLTRATPGAPNLTTPWVDQNQTYTSHSSHQLFLREYAMVDGKPVATGKLLEGDRGLATWADVKAQAKNLLGIELTDADVGNIPLFVMDDYGKFVPGPNGFPQLVTSLGADGKFGGGDDVFVEGDPSSPVNPTVVGALRTGHAFLDDIAHLAATVNSRGQKMYADDDGILGVGVTLVANPAFDPELAEGPTNQKYLGAVNPDFNPDLPVSNANPQYLPLSRFYDNELLDAHYITGDGRGNENIGLSAVHHVFHSEHNHTVEQVKVRAIESGDLAFLNEWLLQDLAEGTQLPPADDLAAIKAFAATLTWDGERLFQAARFTTEMQYQHLVFEEFARKVQPDVDAFVFNPSVDINPAIFAEFAHVVYRFGHSMLNQTVASTNADGTDSGMTLFDAFLNPLAFGSGTVGHDAAAGAIVRGMSGQVGNEIDEFVTDVLRNQLVGIPLDLAALNIARGRDTGMPSLNEARRQFKEKASGDTQLDPYTSWTDFALNLKNPASIVNFIAAYGTHATITDAVGIDAKREAAMKLVFGGDGAPADRLDFLNATGEYAGGSLGGLENVDLWVGGLAEKKMAFGGMLGSTFSFIFELQLENLQNADRFYYLSRVQGLNLFNELENNSLAKMVLNNTDLGETGFALPGDIFSVPDHVMYMDRTMQVRFGHVDPTHSDPFLGAVSSLVERRDANADGVDEYIRYNGNDHVLIQGTDGNDTIVAGGGDDSVWGRGGNDRIEAGYGVDRVHGGAGDDIITNSGTDIGETDMLHGEEGNDVIHGGSGLALVFGNQGQDFLIAGPDGKEIFGGTGNDFIMGGEGGDFLLGNEGDDWIEAGNGFDGTAGDNSELNFNSTIIGHDVMFAGENEHDFDAESGDDIMVQGASVMRNEGMYGYDWAIHKGNQEAADSDLLTPIFTTVEQDILRDRFDQVEALSGWDKNDVLRGDNRGDAATETPPPGANGDAVETTLANNELSQAGVDRIAGLRELLGDLVAAAPSTGDLEKIVAFEGGNILLGGGGSDLIEGRGGNDVIDGDSWLNVRIRITVGNETFTADGMGQKVYRESDLQDGVLKPGATAQFGGKSLSALMLDATLNPGQLSIVREVVKQAGATDVDTAVYWDVVENYTFTRNADGSVTVAHTGFDPDAVPAGSNRVSDGVDRLWNVEKLRFSNGNGGTVDYDLNQLVQFPAVGAPVISDLTPTEGQLLSLDLSSVQDPNGLGPFSYQWQSSLDGTSWTDIAGATGATFRPVDLLLTQFGPQADRQLRVVVSFTDQRGNPETVISASTGPVGANWDGFFGASFTGTRGDDIANGGLFGETFTGNGGNDRVDGGGGTDTAVFAGSAGNYDFGLSGNLLTVADRTGPEGVDSLSSVERLRFGGASGPALTLVSGNNGNNTGATALQGGTGQALGNRADILLGHGGNDTLNGNGGNDVLVGGAGNDTVNGGDGDDLVIQVGGADGRDLVNGGEGTDTYQLNGSAGAETFTIYSVAAALAAIPGLVLAANTEIVIARNGIAIAELDNIEEIVVNTLQVTSPGGSTGGIEGGDTIQVIGDFNGTSLNFSTITIDGTDGDDTVDVTTLGSAHRIVFRSNGGKDTILGVLRPQDVVELAPGLSIDDYEKLVNADGTTTLKSDTHSITYVASGDPMIREHSEDMDLGPEGSDPVANADSFKIIRGEVLKLTVADLLGNDVDPDGDELAVIAIDEDEHGTATLNDDGTITFVPKAGFTGSASFTYLVADGNGGFAEGTVAITVEAPQGKAVRGGDGQSRLKGTDGDDHMHGRGGNDHLHGGEGYDDLLGGAGDDLIDGGSGCDRMAGGKGDDTYIVDDAGDRVIEKANQGIDKVVSTVSYSLGGQHVEKLSLGGIGDIDGTGNGLSNVLRGNSGNNDLSGNGGRDRMDGGKGNDILSGGKGDDSLRGGQGYDTFVFEKNGGRDVVRDFKNGVDKIDVRSFGPDAESKIKIKAVGDDVEIHIGKDVLLLEDTSLRELDGTDFIF